MSKEPLRLVDYLEHMLEAIGRIGATPLTRPRQHSCRTNRFKMR